MNNRKKKVHNSENLGAEKKEEVNKWNVPSVAWGADEPDEPEATRARRAGGRSSRRREYHPSRILSQVGRGASLMEALNQPRYNTNSGIKNRTASFLFPRHSVQELHWTSTNGPHSQEFCHKNSEEFWKFQYGRIPSGFESEKFSNSWNKMDLKRAINHSLPCYTR